MAGTNNFKQWNPTAANQENDTAYNADSLRSGGAGVGAIFPSATANKVLFQLSTMVVALAQTMAAKNYNMQDGNLANLVTALSNILTNADISASLIGNGYFKIAGLMIQWGTIASPANTINTGTFNSGGFPTACFVIVGCVGQQTGTGGGLGIWPISRTQFQFWSSNALATANWIAIGN